MPLTAGSQLGPYEITAAIGAGGMGEVYRARDASLNRDVAIKVLPGAMSSDAERLARFKREAQVLASLNHPNIAHVYGFETATSQEGATVFFLAMEMVEGEDLAERLRRGAIPVDESIDIAKQIALGLEEAHEKGIVHRDLKPANIKLTSDGKVKVLDFGLAKALDGDASSAAANSQLSHSPTMSRHATEAGMIMGTAAYMSPEQARGKIVDKRADIWAFGVVLFEMLAGGRLFAGDTVSDTLAAVLMREIDWTTLPKATPPAIERLLRRCLERDPKKRLRDIGEARLALEGADSGSGGIAVAPSASAAPARGRLRGWIVATLVAVAAGLVGMALGRASGGTPVAQTFSPRTFVAQAIFSARFMPDGQTMIISSALVGNAPSLFESRPGTAAPRPFGPPRTHLLSISKSGELAVLTDVAHIQQRLFRGTLARMTVDGAPRAIADDVREADWLPDGSDLVVVRETGGSDQLEFPIGHVVHKVAGYLSEPRVSPDGTRVAFMEHPVKFDNRGFVKVVDRAGLVTTIAGDFPSENGVSWSIDGRSVFFSADEDDGRASNVFRVPKEGGATPLPLFSSAGSLYLQDIARDGRMAVTREDSRLGIVGRGVSQDAERDLTPLDSSWSPSLSADGTFVVFGDGYGGRDYALMLRNVDGSPPSKLGDGDPGGISPDGRWVSATLFSTGRCVVYPTGAGAMIPIEPGPLQACQNAIWFPDGKSLLITGNEPGKPKRAYRAVFPGGKPEALLPEGLDPRGISPSGQRVLVRDTSRAWQLFEIAGAASAVKGLLPDDRFVEWGADEGTVIVADMRSMPALLHRVRLDTGAREKLGEVGPADRAGLTYVLPLAYRDSGRQYVYSYTRRVSTLYVVNAAR